MPTPSSSGTAFSNSNSVRNSFSAELPVDVVCSGDVAKHTSTDT